MSTTAFDALYYATAFSAIVAVVLAAARDVPLLHLLAPPETGYEGVDFASWLALLILTAIGLGALDGCVPPGLLLAAWIGGLAFFWWSAAWHLRAGR